MLSPSLLNLIFSLVMGVKCVTGLTTIGSCAPECIGVADGDAVADPKNCHRYYVCQHGEPSQVPVECNSLEYFHRSKLSCDLGTCPYPDCTPQCRFEPWTGPGYLAHRTDCSKYYIYDGIGKPIEQECPEGHIFNGIDCDSTVMNDCCDFCLVYCNITGTTVADPKDCTKYYYCDKKYFPDSSISCPVGEKYQYLTGECMTTSTCSQLCTGDVPITPDDCYNSWTCLEPGYFPACQNFCSPRFFSCTFLDIGEEVSHRECTELGYVIDPDSDPLSCVSEEDCSYPYHP